ncbi:MAG: YbdK family carboxylate-amine ligase [Burkholderiaceae bacterium]|nr:YbdK family carboxylate-amine ligase [Burkholderiaceae bacterium]
MPLDAFATSESLSLGVELELQLLNLSDFDLAAASGDLLALLARKPFPGSVTHEITQGMIEVATGIQHRHDALLAELTQMRDVLVKAGDQLNVGVSGGGTHPFQTWPEQRITEMPRYRQVSALYGYLAKQFTIFGQHVHVGCRNGDEALFLLHALGRYVPQFIALSASSPFSHGHDTLFDSSRLNSVFAFPLSGRAPFILDWSQFANDYFAKMEHTGVVRSMKDFYWDIRPKPEYGTIELRVCDTPLTVEHAAALACYLQALCHWLLSDRAALAPLEDDYLVYNYNRFQACRFGLDGIVVDPRSYEQRPIRDDILDMLQRIGPSVYMLGSEAMVRHIERSLAQGNDAGRLRGLHDTLGSLEGVVEQAIATFRAP